VGLTDEARVAAGLVCSIAQYGSTRSINAGVAAGIAMHAWIRQHADPPA
jgi:tRNA G18 (ribose-2'-O)-methylase SpoU